MSTKKQLNAYDQLKALGFLNYHTASKYMLGKTATVIGIVGGHNYGKIGDKFKLGGSNINAYSSSISYNSSRITSSANTFSNINENSSGNSIKLSEFKIGGNTIEDLQSENEYFDKQILELKENIKTNKEKLTFMKANDLKEFDETDFKVYATLDLLEGNFSKVEKAKAIASLIKGS